ncbi:MAG: hypothetical protein OEM47_06495 [Deltaproteobacteria bacterium]|nr:hypothetical protein [Deltaproteobacteria bacterium]
MIQTAIHGRATKILALWLLGLTFAPFDKADDYFFMFLPGQGAARSVCALSFASEISEMIAENALDSHHNCSCLICTMTDLEIATRAPFPPKTPEELGLFPTFPAKSPYYCEIFHPPRA